MVARHIMVWATRLAESHPFAWKIAWEAVHHLPFLLPHDKSYHALRHFIKAAGPRGLFLDIGANDGISVLSFRKFDKEYRILSLEPNSMLEPALKKIKASDPYFEYKMIGAGSRPERLCFFVPIYHGIILHTFTATRREQVKGAVAACFGKCVAAACFIQSIESEIVRVDDLNVNPTIVKIDAEGFDYEVLRGLDATLARTRPFMIIEVAWAEKDTIAQYLDDREYALLAYDHETDRFSRDSDAYRSGHSGHRNSFAIPKEKLHCLPVD